MSVPGAPQSLTPIWHQRRPEPKRPVGGLNMDEPRRGRGKRTQTADPPESAARLHGGRCRARVGAGDAVEHASIGIPRAGTDDAQPSALSEGQHVPDDDTAKSVSVPEDPMAMLGPAARQQDHEQEGLGSAEKGAACAHEHSSDPTGQADDCSTAQATGGSAASTAQTTGGSAAKGRKKAKLDWPPVEPGQQFEYVFTGTESAIASTYSPDVMLRLKGQKVKAICVSTAQGTGKIAISSFPGGPSGQNPVNFVRSAASWCLKTNERALSGKGHQLALHAFLTKKDSSESAGVCTCSSIGGPCAWSVWLSLVVLVVPRLSQ